MPGLFHWLFLSHDSFYGCYSFWQTHWVSLQETSELPGAIALYNISITVCVLIAVTLMNALLKMWSGAPGRPSLAQLEAANQALEQEILERQGVEESLRKAAERFQQALEFEALLKRITDKVRDSLDEDQILQAMLRELAQGLGVKSCNAALYNLETHTATVRYEHTTTIVPVQGRVMDMRNSPQIYRQLLAGQYFQYCATQPNPERGRVAMLACPIIDDQGVLGDLWLINDQHYEFKDLELRLVQQVANHCAIAMRQARLYQTAQAQVQELTHLNQLKDDFLSTVSHELRTPVANIKVASHMLEVVLEQSKFLSISDHRGMSCSAHRKIEQYLKILKNECQREIQLIEDLLDLRHLEENPHPLLLEMIDLQNWLPQFFQTFKVQAQNRQQQINLDIRFVDPLLFVSELKSLERILTELLHNACKYTPPGEKISMQVSATFNLIEFHVVNSGVEISDRELGHIFDKFYRIPSADPWRQGGTGLGLALVQKLTDRLGGVILAQSQNNHTTFTLTLPLKMAVASSLSQYSKDCEFNKI